MPQHFALWPSHFQLSFEIGLSSDFQGKYVVIHFAILKLFLKINLNFSTPPSLRYLLLSMKSTKPKFKRLFGRKSLYVLIKYAVLEEALQMEM